MSAPGSNDRTKSFMEAWAQAFAQVVGQSAVASLQVNVLDREASAKALQGFSSDPLRTYFAAGGRLSGTLSLAIPEADAVRFAQLLLMETGQPEVKLDDSHRDAYAELVRQAAGIVSAGWKFDTSEIALNYAGLTAPGPLKPGTVQGLEIRGENFPAALLVFELDEVLLTTLEAPPPDARPAEKAPAAGNTNLGLLLEMPLEATIRFGQRQLLLRDVLALAPGSVVELNRRIHEPAELLVAGRVVACGEVVVVDGNFGLRITELSTAKQRADLLRDCRG